MILLAGTGDDALLGAAGNNLLAGAVGEDVLLFGTDFSNDRVIGWQDSLATLQFDDVLWNRSLTAQGFLDNFTSLVSGSLEFPFTGGQRPILQGYTNITALSDDPVIV